MPIVSIKKTQSLTNESKVRLIAFFVLLITCIYLWNAFILLPFFLVFDFGLRSFDLSKYSPLAILSDWLVKTLQLQVKLVYLPPKRFAARIGFIFSIVLLLLHIAGVNNIIISSILGFFAALESFAGICVGCYIFNFVQRFRKQNL